MPVAALFMVAGFHVPAIPLEDVEGNEGAGVPAQNGAIGGNVGTNIGSDKMIPVKRLVVQPLIVSAKLA